MRTAAIVLIVVCASSLTLRAQEANADGTTAVIRELEHDWVDGQSHNDNRALDLIFDNSLVYIEYGKLMSKGEYLSRIRRAGPALSQIVMEAMTVRVSGRTAVTVGTYREREVGKSGVKRWRFVDTWVNKKGGWVLVAAAAAPLSEP